ncbi:MAG: hypothetical protein V1738_03915 [Patescibacteria group bacterium]
MPQQRNLIKIALCDESDKTLARYSDRQWALHDQCERAQREQQIIGKAGELVKGLQKGHASFGYMQDFNRHSYWLFVKRISIALVAKALQISELECIVIPDVLKPIAEHTVEGETILESDVLAQRIASELTNVSVGGWGDIQSVPCDVCGETAPIVCRRWDWDGITIVSAGVLCLQCPRYMESGTRQEAGGWTAPFLQTK